MKERVGITALAWGATAVTFAFAPGASGEIASALLQEDAELPGMPGEIIASISNTAASDAGGYAATLSTSGEETLSRVWGSADGGPGMLLRTESLIGVYDQTSFESFFGMSNMGAGGYSAIVTDTSSGETSLDTAWLDDDPLLVEGDAVDAFPGFFSSFNSRVGVTGSGLPYWVGGLTDVRGGSTVFRAIFMGTTADAVIAEGDEIQGVKLPATGIDFDVRFSTEGSHWINLIPVDAPTTEDGVLVINGAAAEVAGSVIREGSPVPDSAGGLPGENWDNFDFFGITEALEFLATGDTDAATTVDEFVFVTDQIVLREGDMLDLGGEMVTISGAIEGGYMNDDADWAVIWDVNTVAGNIEALILNAEIILAEGDAVDWNGDGVIDGGDEGAVIDNFTGISSLTMTGRDASGGLSLYFTADVELASAEVLEGFFCLPIPGEAACQEDLDQSGSVGFADLVQLLSAWGPCPGCAEDFNGDDVVGFSDLIQLLSAWGPCP